MISVIIPTLNEEKFVGGILSDLTSQLYKDFEVIVADSKSEDRTREVVKSFEDKLNVKLVLGDARGVALARNHGADAASGEWLLFLDADVRIGPNFLERFIVGAKKKGLDAASAYTKPLDKKLIYKLGNWLTMRYMLSFQRSKSPMAGGYCILVKKVIHQKIGGFDPKLKLAEDHDYLTRAVKAGAKFRYVKSARIGVSMRRFEEKGRFKLAFDYIKSEIYRFAHKGRIEKEIVKYEFGGHGENNKN
ncbi:MAG: glycosyltransferase [Candidatus Colwellbacteria bacterium]|nr:glycosyltransferase [Candidatus Colwellbacteria bacterium]